MGHLTFIANQGVKSAAQVKSKYGAGVSVCVCVYVGGRAGGRVLANILFALWLSSVQCVWEK